MATVKYEDLSDMQKSCVDHDGNKDLLIRGIAGSGKSLVLANRAVKLLAKSQKEGKKVKIGFFSYTNTLCKYTEDYIKHLGLPMDSVTICTADTMLKNVYKYNFNNGRDVHIDFGNNKKINNSWSPAFWAIRNAMDDIEKNKRNRFLDKDKPAIVEFVRSEIYWIRQRWSKIKSKEDYLRISRTGRGNEIRPSIQDRGILYDIYQKYFQIMRENSYYDDKEEIYANLDKHKERISDAYKFNYVFIDECQDLGLTQLSVLCSLATQSCTFAADLSQKIYNNGFAWKEIGIDVRGRNSKKLNGTYRNSQEIWNLAESLKRYNEELQGNPEEDNTDAETPVRRTGMKPEMYRVENIDAENEIVMSLIRKIQASSPAATIGILCRRNDDLEIVKNFLNKKNIRNIEMVDRKGNHNLFTPGIKLSTYHSSKGLEFDAVILPFLNADIFPKIYKNMDQDMALKTMAAARNLFYVAITRAKEVLCITSSGVQSPLIGNLDPLYYERR